MTVQMQLCCDYLLLSLVFSSLPSLPFSSHLYSPSFVPSLSPLTLFILPSLPPFAASITSNMLVYTCILQILRQQKPAMGRRLSRQCMGVL